MIPFGIGRVDLQCVESDWNVELRDGEPSIEHGHLIDEPTMKLMAPASDAIVNVRIPAGEREGPSPLRRSRSAPINRPIPSATTSFKITGSKMYISPSIKTAQGPQAK